MRSGYFGRCWEGLALFRASCVVLTVKFGDFDADSRCLEWFVSGIHGEIRLAQLRLTLFGAIDTVWRMGIAVFGLCDAAALCQCRRVVSIGEAWGAEFRNEAPPYTPRNMDTFCRPVAPAQQWQYDKSETRSNPR